MHVHARENDGLDFAKRATISLGLKADAWRRVQIKAIRAWLSKQESVSNVGLSCLVTQISPLQPNLSPHIQSWANERSFGRWAERLPN